MLLIHERVKFRAREAGRALGDDREVDIRSERLLARVDPQNLFAIATVGEIDGDAPVETAGAQERRVEDIGTIGRRHDDDFFGRFETVHLDENLIESLFALVVPAAYPAAAHAADRVYFIDKDDCRRRLFCKLKKVPYS
jgi:hypothetical protein